jgi:hypothetical protein
MFGRKSGSEPAAAADAFEGRPWNIGADKWFNFWPAPFSRLMPAKPAAADEATMISDAERFGREAGSAAGRGEHFAGQIGSLPGREALVYVGLQRTARVKQNADAIRRDLDTQLSGLQSQVATAEQDEAWTGERYEKARRERAQRPETAKPGNFSGAALYAAVLAILACAEFPTIYAALQRSPLPTEARWVITAALSIIIALSAHIVGEYLWEFVAKRETATSDNAGLQEKTERILKLVIAAGIFIVMVVLMLKMYSIRTDIFVSTASDSAEQKAKRAAEGTAFSQLLLYLQLLFFIVALSMSFLRTRNEPERRKNALVRRELKALEKDIDKAKERLDEDRQKKVAVGAQIQTLSRLLESVQLAEELELEREDALLNEILKRHDNQYESAEHSGPLRA